MRRWLRHLFARDRSFARRSLACETLESRQMMAITIDVGSHELFPNRPNQTVMIQAVSTDPQADPAVTGFNLRAQIGDGLESEAEPVFDGTDFSSGIWDAFATTVALNTIPGHEQFAQSSVIFNSLGDDVLATGTVVTLSIDTTDFSAGNTFDLLLDSPQIGAPSNFILFGGTGLPPEISNGSITLVSPWQNPIDPIDVDGDGSIFPLDALTSINEINARGTGPLPLPPVPPPDGPPPYYDVDGDGSLLPIDVLAVINHINANLVVPGPAPNEPFFAMAATTVRATDSFAVSGPARGSSDRAKDYAAGSSSENGPAQVAVQGNSHTTRSRSSPTPKPRQPLCIRPKTASDRAEANPWESTLVTLAADICRLHQA